MPPKGSSKAPNSRSSAKPASTKGKPASRTESKAPVSSSSTKGQSRKRTSPSDAEEREGQDANGSVGSPSSKAPVSKKAKKDTNGNSEEVRARGEGVPEIVQEENEDEQFEQAVAQDHAQAEGSNAEHKSNGQEADVPMKGADANSIEQADQVDVDEPAPAPAAPKRANRSSLATGAKPPPSSASQKIDSTTPAVAEKPKHRTVAALASGSTPSSGSGSGPGAGSSSLPNGATGGEKKKTAVGRRSIASSAGGGSRRKAEELPLVGAAEHLRPARSVLIFGSGEMGQLGLGDDMREEIHRPRVHKWFDEAIREGKLGGEGAGVEDVAVGGLHSLVIDEKGRIWSWGVNDNGALGRLTSGPVDPNEQDPRTNKEETDPRPQLNNDELESEPMLVESLETEGFRAVRVAAGDSISVAIDDKGGLRYWGSFRGNEGLIGFGGQRKVIQYLPTALPKNAVRTGVKFVAIAAGADHVLLLSTQGKVYAMGDGAKSQLGRKINNRNSVMHGLVPEPLGLKNIELISAGSYHSFAVDKDGQVYAWGFNAAGQTGVAESKKDRTWESDVISAPTIIDALAPGSHNGAKVISISAGDRHSLFLFSDGSLWGCGNIVEGEVGLAKDHPAMSDEAKEEQCISEPVQIYFPPPPSANDKAPALTPYEDSEAYRKASSRVVNMSAGPRHNLAITTDGRVYSWGLGLQAQLGLGADTDSVHTPTLVIGKAVTENKPLLAAAGGQHCIILARKNEEA